MNIRFTRDDFKFLIGILVCLFVFYPTLFWARSALLVADHLWQHYPWTKLLWDSIHQFKLPFWTPLIHCGFPIAAESQIGIYYPANLLLDFLLPLKWAYSYTIAFHFLLSGVGMYFYARQIGLKAQGSFISAFLFLFGSAHGGAYYSIASLKTISWLPLGLFLFERAYQEGKWRYFVYLSFVFAMSLIAGYMQLGTLCIFTLMIYAFLRVLFFPKPEKNNFTSRFKAGLGLVVSMLLALALAFPQLLLSYPLALLSNRVGVAEEYAYVGSMFPGAILTVFFPHWYVIFRGNNLYMGIFSLFLMIASFGQTDASLKKFFKLWCWMGIIALLMALGQWSPFYVAFVKLTHFYSFRTPAKYVVFVCLSLAVLGGLGFQQLWDLAEGQKKLPLLGQIGRRFLVVCLFFVASIGLIFSFLTVGKKWALKLGDWLIASFIYGKVGHPHSLEIYRMRFEQSTNYILSFFSFHPWTMWNIGMIFTGIIFSLWLIKAGRRLRIWLVAGFIFLFVDLYGFASIMFKKGFDDYQATEISSPVIKYLAQESEKGLISRVYAFYDQWNPIPVRPSLNMLYGYPDIGAYSPFVMRRYYETIGLMGNVDDSNFPYWPEPGFVLNHLNLLKLTGVSHILTSNRFVHDDLELLMEDVQNDLFLYRFKSVRSKAFFVSRLEVVKDWEALKKVLIDSRFDPFSSLVIEESEASKVEETMLHVQTAFKHDKEPKIVWEIREPEFERWHVMTSHPGYFIVANSYYPGWQAWVNERPVKILKAYGLFQVVPITKAGSNIVEFRFHSYGSKKNSSNGV